MNGITLGTRGMLVSCNWKHKASARNNPLYTIPERIVRSQSLCERFERLDPMQRLRVVELLYRPTGYTVITGRSPAAAGRLGRRLGSLVIEL